MSDGYSHTNGYRQARKPNPVIFLVLVIMAAAVCALAVYMGAAPIKSLFPEDWMGWSRTAGNWAVALGAGALILLISVIGLVISTFRLLMFVAQPKRPANSYLSPDQLSANFSPAAEPDLAETHFPDADLAPFPAVNSAPIAPLAAAPLAEALAAQPVTPAPKAPTAPPIPVAPPVLVAAPAPVIAPSPVVPHILKHDLELESLEPAVFPDPQIFSDNASDSFLTRSTEPVGATFNAAAALSDTHGLHVAPLHVATQAATNVEVTAALPTAEIIQLHPEITPEPIQSDAPSDPVEAALLADGPAITPRHIPPSDMNAVITSAMSFIAADIAPIAAPAAEKIYESLPGGADMAFVPVAVTPVASEPAVKVVEDHSSESAAPEVSAPELMSHEPTAIHADKLPVAPFPVAESPVPEVLAADVLATHAPAPEPHVSDVQEPEPVTAPAAAPNVDPDSEIRQVSQTVLSVWPDATRAIAADELSVRLTRLYNDPAPESQKAFKLLGSGDLSAATNVIAAHADALDAAAHNSEAAEMWRIYGALHMGRDDPKALLAYEHVSELDPSDANIHVYLARRYQMAGDTLKQPAVISRALAVVTDPATRAEFLPTFADLKLKAGDHKAAGDALEELSRLQETATYLKPDDVAAKSAYAITVARLAQAREMSGQYTEASPMYMKAYQAFSLLSKEKPDHAGLKAMAENALKDYNRLTQTAAV